MRTVRQIPRANALGIWPPISHAPSCIVTTNPSRTGLNPLSNTKKITYIFFRRKCQDCIYGISDKLFSVLDNPDMKIRRQWYHCEILLFTHKSCFKWYCICEYLIFVGKNICVVDAGVSRYLFFFLFQTNHQLNPQNVDKMNKSDTGLCKHNTPHQMISCQDGGVCWILSQEWVWRMTNFTSLISKTYEMKKKT